LSLIEFVSFLDAIEKKFNGVRKIWGAALSSSKKDIDTFATSN
jgi:hypothetical protein